MYEGAANSEPLVSVGQRVTYWGVFPALVTLGVVTNGLGIVVLRRPPLKSLQVNRYLQILAWCDLLLCVLCLPIILSAAGCVNYNYGLTWYFAYLGWTLPDALHAFSTYTLAWLALDRCLAVWWHAGYNFTQQALVQQLRAATTAALCLFTHIPFMVNGDVVCINWEHAEDNTTWGQMDSNTSSRQTESQNTCISDSWKPSTGFENSYDQTWHRIFRSVYVCVVWWGPGVLMAAFNLSLVVAVLQGRVRYRPSTEFKEGRQGVLAGPWEQNLVITMIAMATSYLVLTLPLTIFLTYYADSASDQCSKSEPHDILRLVASSLAQFQHVIHPVFLVCINPAFKRELRNILHFAVDVVPHNQSLTVESNTNTLT